MHIGLLASVEFNVGGRALDIHDAIRADIGEYALGAPQFDDITLVVLVRELD